MTKKWNPKKVRKLSYPKTSAKVIDEWFINYATLMDIMKSTGIARSTLFRWKKQMIADETISLQDLVTVTNYKKLIELERQDYEKADEAKSEAKAKRDKLVKQAKELEAQLSAKGFDVKIKAPSTNQIKRRTKKTAKFDEILTLERDTDLEKNSLARSMFNKLSERDKKAYETYKKDKTNE